MKTYTRRKAMQSLTAGTIASLGMVRGLLDNPVLAQDDRKPQGPALVFLNVVAKEPKTVLKALSR